MEEETQKVGDPGDSDKAQQEERITRKEVFKKVGKYAAYCAAAVAVLFASPDKAACGSQL